MTNLPKHLDPWQYAHKGAQNGDVFSGVFNISEMPRLQKESLDIKTVSVDIEISKRADAKIILLGNIKASVGLICQRCLSKMDFNIDHDFSFILFKSELARVRYFGDEEETQMDDEDALICEEVLDIVSLVEDEVLVSLPMISRHDDCDVNLDFVAKDDLVETTKHPFADLKKLIK